MILARRQQRAFIHEICEIRTRHSGRSASERRDVHVVGHGLVANVHAQNAFASTQIGCINHNLAIETTRAQQRRIEHIWTVGRRDQNDTFIRLETIHLDQQLVERLLAFVVSTT